MSALAASPRVFFFYPRTGVSGQPPSLGFGGETWESIPGARGCTAQSCGFRDLYAQFQMLGVNVLGISTSTIEHQSEFKRRQHIPFEFLSDSGLRLTKGMSLPTFEFPVESGGPTTLLRRMAWYCERSVIRKVWYPVFPPDECAANVLEWIKGQGAIGIEPIGPSNIEFVRAELRKHWRSTTIFSRGVRFEADTLPGLVASVGGEPVGHLTFHSDKQGLEVITLASTSGSQGVGSALMDRAELAARERKCRRFFLTTTNDNLHALRFYQRRGMRLAKVLQGMMDRYRDAGEPVPYMGMNSIPLRDEIELEIILET